MRVHVLADLHREFGLADIPTSDADVIVLAGDIDVGANGLEWIRRRFPNQRVIYVLGNHELYRQNLTTPTAGLKRETGSSHIHLLENSVVELYGVTFPGCTLWTDFALRGDMQNMGCAETCINDYRIVRIETDNRVLRRKTQSGFIRNRLLG